MCVHTMISPSLTWHSVGDRSLNLPSLGQKAFPSTMIARRLWILQPHSQCDGTCRFSADPSLGVALQLSPSLTNPAQTDISV